MTFQRIINNEEELRTMFVNATEVSRQTGWAPGYVTAKMQQYGKRGLVLAGKPAWWSDDLKDVIRQLEEEKKKYPMAPSTLPVPQA